MLLQVRVRISTQAARALDQKEGEGERVKGVGLVCSWVAQGVGGEANGWGGNDK